MTDTTQIWQPVKGYENRYEVSNDGIVRSIGHSYVDRNGKARWRHNRILQQRLDRAGYYTIRLTQKNKTSTKYMHRILAEAFIPQPAGKEYVNHRNGNKQDNRLKNLEWCTHAENVQHAYNQGLIKIKTKRVVNKCTGQEFASVKEAASFYAIDYGTMRNYLNGNIRNNPTCLRFKEES